MRIICTHCKTSYNVNLVNIKPEGIEFKCAKVSSNRWCWGIERHDKKQENASMKFLFISVQRSLEVYGLKHLHYSLIANSFKSSILFVPAPTMNLEDDSLDDIQGIFIVGLILFIP